MAKIRTTDNGWYKYVIRFIKIGKRHQQATRSKIRPAKNEDTEQKKNDWTKGAQPKEQKKKWTAQNLWGWYDMELKTEH